MESKAIIELTRYENLVKESFELEQSIDECAHLEETIKKLKYLIFDLCQDEYNLTKKCKIISHGAGMKNTRRTQMKTNSVFSELREINVNEHVEKKNELSYLSWAWAFDELFKRYPSAKYEVKWFDGKPYLYDPVAGYMVFTSITVKGQTKDMWLPVINYDYMAMKDKPYQYSFRKWNKSLKKYEYITKTCEAVNMFEINFSSSHQRLLSAVRMRQRLKYSKRTSLLTFFLFFFISNRCLWFSTWPKSY